jgi:hypothetical protein
MQNFHPFYRFYTAGLDWNASDKSLTPVQGSRRALEFRPWSSLEMTCIKAWPGGVLSVRKPIKFVLLRSSCSFQLLAASESQTSLFDTRLVVVAVVNRSSRNPCRGYILSSFYLSSSQTPTCQLYRLSTCCSLYWYRYSIQMCDNLPLQKSELVHSVRSVRSLPSTLLAGRQCSRRFAPWRKLDHEQADTHAGECNIQKYPVLALGHLA